VKTLAASLQLDPAYFIFFMGYILLSTDLASFHWNEAGWKEERVTPLNG